MDATIQSLNYLDSMPLMNDESLLERRHVATFSEGLEESITVCVASRGSSQHCWKRRKAWPPEKGSSHSTMFEAGPLKGAVLVGRGIFQYSFQKFVQFPAWQPFFPMT